MTKTMSDSEWLSQMRQMAEDRAERLRIAAKAERYAAKQSDLPEIRQMLKKAYLAGYKSGSRGG